MPGECSLPVIWQRKILNLNDYSRIVSLLKSFNFFKPLPQLNTQEIIQAMLFDKKKKNNNFTFILPLTIGVVKEFNDIRENEIIKILNDLIC